MRVPQRLGAGRYAHGRDAFMPKLRAAVAHVEAGRPAARAWEMLEAGHAEAVEVMSAAERPPTARPEARTAAARAGADSGGAGAARGGGAGLGAGGAGGGGA